MKTKLDYIDTLKKINILVIGEGISNKSVIKFFQKNNIKYNHMLNTFDSTEFDIESYNLIIKAPVIPFHDAIIKKAILAHIPIITEIELSYQILKAQSPSTKIIGITGTNGKTTTTMMIDHILKENKIKSIACGNIGVPLMDVILEEKIYDFICLELSSFQLESIIDFTPDYVVLLNLANDHLDHHQTFEEYQEAKFNIFKNMQAGSWIFYFEDIHELVSGACEDKDYINLEGVNPNSNEYFFEMEEMHLKGNHNFSNMVFASRICSVIGISDAKIQKALKTFKAPKYRLQYIKTIGGVKIYNDSKSTNLNSLEQAINAFDEEIILIMGGRNKLGDNWQQIFNKKNISEIYAYGENREMIPTDFSFINLEEAVKAAFTKNKENHVILLFSPGAASQDQYQNFEERGKHFNKIIEKLEE